MGRHARLIVRHVAQFETTATTAVIDQFREGVGQAAGTDVVNELDRILVAELQAAIDHFLTERLHLGRSEEHTSDLQSLRSSSYAVLCLKKISIHIIIII